VGKDKDYNDIIGRDSVDVTVVVTGREPKITLPQNVYDIRCGDTNSFTFTADGRPGPDISVTSSNAPPVSFSFDGGRACYTNEYVGNFTFEPTVPNDYDFLFTVSNSVGVVSTNVTVRVSSVASALGFDSTEVTADEIVCQVKSFGISDNCVTGTVELVAEEGGTVVQESTNISHIVKFTMLGGDTPGDMAPLPEECHAALTSRTAPFGFRVAGPVANRFFKVSLDAGRRAR
jgi:hypothetical protein